MSGLSIVVINSDAYSRNQYIINGVAKALARSAHVKSCKVATYRTLVADAKKDPADILIVIGGSGGYADIIRSAARFVPYTVFWATEDPYELRNNLEFSRIFQIVYTNEEASVPAYQGRAKFLPLGADKDVHYREIKAPQDRLFDLFFVGTAWPDRIETLNAVIRALPATYRFKIGLSGNQYLPNFALGDLNNITSFRVSPREFASMANRSTVTLTLDRSFSLGHGTGPSLQAKTPPPRLFEIAAAGSSQVYLSKRGASRTFFDDGAITEVDDTDKAAKAIVALVMDDAKRMRLCRNAQLRVMSAHLYDNRAETVLADFLAWRQKSGGDVANDASPAQPKADFAKDDRRRVLCVTHNAMGRHPFGGVEIYQQNVLATLPGFDFFFLFPDRDIGRLILTNRSGKTEKIFDAGPILESAVQDRLREHILHQIIEEYAIDIVHYHHLLGHPLSLPIHSHAAGIPSVLQMHDYFMLCREFNLIGLSGKYCQIRDPETSICNICLSSRGIAPPGAQARRRHVVTTALEHVDLILHSSKFSLEKLAEIYPGVPREKNRIVGLAIADDQLASLLAVRGSPAPDEKLRICILGNFTKNKGSEFLTQMFWELRSGPYAIRILGRIDDVALASHISETFPNVEVLGSYTPEMLPALLAQTDVSIHFSIWPETYCLSVDEAWAAGIVPIVLGFGALGERVRDRKTGFVINPNRPHDLVPLIKEIAVHKELLKEMVVDAAELRSRLAAHRHEIASIYNGLIGDVPPRLPSLLPARARLSTDELDIRFCSDDWTSEAIVVDRAEEGYVPGELGSLDFGPLQEPQDIDFETIPKDINAFLHPSDHEIYLTIGGEKAQLAADIAFLLPASAEAIDVILSCPPTSLCTLNVVIGGHARRLEPTLRRERERHHDLTYRLLRESGEPDNSFFLVTVAGRPNRHYFAGPYIAGIKRAARERKAVLPNGAITGALIETAPTFLDRRLRRAQTFFNARKAPMRMHLDSCNGTPMETQSRVHIDRHAQSMQIRGWAVPKLIGSFGRIGFRIVGKDYALEGMCTLERREDLVAALGRSDVLWSGFQMEVPVGKLRSGTYSLIVRGTSSDGRMSFSGPVAVTLD